MGGKGRGDQGQGQPAGQPPGTDTSAMEQAPLPLKTVVFPCELPNWAAIKVAVKKLGTVKQADKLIAQLNKIYTLVIEGTTQLLGHTEPERFIFDNLKRFLIKKCSEEEVHSFYNIALPCIVERALQIEQLRPPGGLPINKQQQGCEIELSRPLVASIVSCAFLCLFPGRKRDRRTRLNSINFLGFFKQLPSGPQCAKLRCVLHYFERIAADPQGPPGNMVFKRQVMSQHRLPSLADWLSCDMPLCAMDVHHEGGIEDSGSATMQVDFANRYIGGGSLTGGKVQEEIRFCLSPELISSMLFMESMEDNEAIHIQGYETYSKYTGYNKTLKFAGMNIDPAKTDARGNLESLLCAIDATPFRQNPEDQYSAKCVLRELNKAYVGFVQCQDLRRPSSGSFGRRAYRNSSMTSEEEDFYSAIESLDSEHGEDGAGGVPEVGHVGASMSQAIMASAVKDAVDARKSQDQPAHGGDMGDGEEGMGLLPGIAEGVADMGHSNIDQLEVDRAWLMAIRRRSSQLSDVSRRSSSSTKTSSEMSSEFEEYFESFQRHEHRLRHTAKKEKSTDCDSA